MARSGRARWGSRSCRREFAKWNATSAVCTGPGSAAHAAHGWQRQFDSYGRYFYELFRLPGTSKPSIDAHTDITRAPSASRLADAAGAGVVLHAPAPRQLGLAERRLAGQGYTVTVVAEPVEPPELFEWFVETRRRLGMRVIALSPSAGSEGLAALRSTKRCACSATGTSPATAWRWSSWASGRPCPPVLPRLRACGARAPVLPVGCYFRPDGRQRIHVLEPIDTRTSGVYRDDVAPRHPGARRPVRRPHPRPTRALASPPAELAQQPRGVRRLDRFGCETAGVAGPGAARLGAKGVCTSA